MPVLPLVLALTGAFDFVTTAKADLDGDGAEEEIHFAALPTGIVAYDLSIGGAKLGKRFEVVEDLRFAIVDLDSTDKQREVLIKLEEANDLRDFILVRYFEKKVVELGRFGGQVPSEPELSGNGFVVYGSWQGFYARTIKLALDAKKQKLQELVPELYAVELEVKVKESFPLYTTRGKKEVLARVKVGTQVRILAHDPAAKAFLVRSSTGLLGWVMFTELEKGAELPWAG
jgi:hypothetical protein